jgi:hypothetical protein
MEKNNGNILELYVVGKALICSVFQNNRRQEQIFEYKKPGSQSFD